MSRPGPGARAGCRRIARAALALAVLALPLGACARKSEEAAPKPGTLKVGLVFDVGGRGDKSFNDAAYAGLDSAQRALGIEFQTLESGEGADREAGLRQLAASGSQLVFGVGFLFTDDIRALAKEFPNVHFACVDYTVTAGEALPSNLRALKFKEEEGSFLVGALSGLL